MLRMKERPRHSPTRARSLPCGSSYLAVRCHLTPGQEKAASDRQHASCAACIAAGASHLTSPTHERMCSCDTCIDGTTTYAHGVANCALHLCRADCNNKPYMTARMSLFDNCCDRHRADPAECIDAGTSHLASRARRARTTLTPVAASDSSTAGSSASAADADSALRRTPHAAKLSVEFGREIGKSASQMFDDSCV